jgi:Fe-S cluster biogenesis protein NfuA
MVPEIGDDPLIQRIEAVLDSLRPNIQMDGGDIELVKFEDGIVYIKLLGACVGCSMSIYTLKMGIEEALKAELPEVLEVLPVED